MPNAWTDYYQTAFDEDIAKSVELLKTYNPRINLNYS